MSGQHPLPPLVALPEDLDDEAAAALLEFFHDAARVLEHHYAGQLIGRCHRPDSRRRPLSDDQPPF